MYRKLLIFVALVLLIGVTTVAAQEEIDPSIFVIITDSSGYYAGGSGWYAGYVVYGSGTYDLQMFATGGENNGLWPVTDVRIVVAISTEAWGGGLESLTITNSSETLTLTPTDFTSGPCPNWPMGPGESVGGPFSEPDYYGYNDDYNPGDLTLTSGTRDNPKILTVTVTFSDDATEASKVALLAYGTDAKGKPAKTPYSGGTTFVVPELGTLLLTLAPLAALTTYALKRKKS